MGAQVIRTPSEAASDSPESHISTQRKRITFNFLLGLANNPLAHYEGTAEEIIDDCGDHLDMMVIGAGTGGTITGVAKRLKQRYPNIIIVGVDPVGSILSNFSLKEQQSNLPYQVVGIGYDFIPKVLDRSLIDRWISSNDSDSFEMSRKLIKKEGLLCGGSSGSATWAAIQAIRAYNFHSDPSKRVLIILPDSIRNYMSKFIDSDWMLLHKFISSKVFQQEQNLKHFGNAMKPFELISVPTLRASDSLKNCVKSIKTMGKFPVLESNKILVNLDSLKLFHFILREGKEVAFSTGLERFIDKNFILFTSENDFMDLLTASFANTSIYFSDSDGNAILSADGLVQTINPFSVLQ